MADLNSVKMIATVLLLFISLSFAEGGSCQGRCGDNLDRAEPCQCNTACERFDDCCSDYESLCVTGSSNSALLAASARLWNADVNAYRPSEFSFNLQAQTTASSNSDLSPQRLFYFVNESRFSTPTYRTYIALLDNYNTKTGEVEPSLSVEEQNEVLSFLDAVMSTEVFSELLEFLVSQNLVNNAASLRSTLVNLWFDFYPRSGKSGAVTDSSGFEHVFVGEKKSGSITGFHSWIQFYLLERNNNINYYGYNAFAQPNLIEAHFSWDGLRKTRGSLFIGTSPEYDLAIYTLCMLARPGSTCSTSAAGHAVNIQTYDVGHKTGLQVASAFPMVNGQ